MAVVVVQMGHCFRTEGPTGTNGEQGFAAATAERCAARLAEAGHAARVIRADPPRTSEYDGDMFVAIHCDGSTSVDARGASVGYQTDEGRRFAHAWADAYVREGWAGGWRPDNYTAALAGYYGVREAVKKGTDFAFIAEAGFLTNPGNRALLDSPEGHDRFARALVAAVSDVLGKPLPSSQTEDDVQPTIVTADNGHLWVFWRDRDGFCRATAGDVADSDGWRIGTRRFRSDFTVRPVEQNGVAGFQLVGVSEDDSAFVCEVFPGHGDDPPDTDWRPVGGTIRGRRR